ncbi:3-oxoacyl-ACP synthase, partial [Streptococcus pneumoniae]
YMMAREIVVDRAKLPSNMTEYAKSSAACIPILLSACVQQALIPSDGSQTVLLPAFVGGLTGGTLSLTI